MQAGSGHSFWIVYSAEKDVLCTAEFMCCSCYCVLTMEKQKCKFMNELESKYLYFQNGPNEWTPVWYVN